MSKKIVTTLLLLLGAALASNCGGDSDAPASSTDGGMGPGGSGSPGEAGQPSVAGTSGGTVSSAGMGTGGLGEAGNAPTAGSGEVDGGSGGAAGAGDAGGAGGAASTCAENIVDFPKLYAEAICRKRIQCCANDSSETCMTEVSEALAKIYPDLAKSAQEGTAEADCAAFEQCIAAVDAKDCSAWPEQDPMVYGVPAGEPACRNMIKGKLAPTTLCASTYQCDSGFCASNNDQEPTKCLALAADGEPCGDTGFCNLATSYCNEISNKCAPRHPNGAACTHVDQCLSRRCDTVDTGKCIAPASNQCKFVPEGCSLGRGPMRNSLAWSLLVVGLVLGAGARRRSRVRAA